jgi:hypothetical protein
MPVQGALVETTDYRLLLVLPDSRKVLAISDVDGYHLPSISITQWTRPAEQLQKAIRAAWKLHVLTLEFLEGSPPCAVAEILAPGNPSGLDAVSLEQLHSSELIEQHRQQLIAMFAGQSYANSPFFRVGWIDEAIAWVESETGRKLSSKSEIEQYNAGGGFMLVRFRSKDGLEYWLKATGPPNTHEFSITSFLSELGTSHLPELTSTKPAWNAWLMKGEGIPMVEVPTTPFEAFTLLEDVVISMAELQMKTEGHSLGLLAAGAFDQSPEVLGKNASELFDYLEEVMGLQTSSKIPRLEKQRLHEIRGIFEEVCHRAEVLDMPETIVHGDMNRGNILTGIGHCQFIDWSEAYLGNPLITLQHLLLLNKVENTEVRNFINRVLKYRYRDVWLARYDPKTLDEGFVYMSLLAIASSLYRRGDWLNSPLRNDARRQSYARTLARLMDRAALEPQLLEALCY